MTEKFLRNIYSSGAALTEDVGFLKKSSNLWSPQTILLPQGIPELQGCVFDFKGWSTDLKKNLEKLALYAAKMVSHGSDMHFCITHQTMINLMPPAKPELLADQYEELDYKIARAEFIKHYKVLRSQLFAFYSNVWRQYTERL